MPKNALLKSLCTLALQHGGQESKGQATKPHAGAHDRLKTADSDTRRILGGRAQLFSTTEADKVLVGEKSVKAGVRLTSLAHEASEGNDGVLGSGHLAVFVNLKVSE